MARRHGFFYPKDSMALLAQSVGPGNDNNNYNNNENDNDKEISKKIIEEVELEMVSNELLFVSEDGKIDRLSFKYIQKRFFYNYSFTVDFN